MDADKKQIEFSEPVKGRLEVKFFNPDEGKLTVTTVYWAQQCIEAVVDYAGRMAEVANSIGRPNAAGDWLEIKRLAEELAVEVRDAEVVT